MMVALPLVLACALKYSLLSLLAAVGYLRSRPPRTTATEPISILKPLAGLDDGLESNLRTFFEQDYPAFEILFAVREANDPAVGIVKGLQREYRHVKTRLLVSGESPYPNAKVFSLDRMLAAAANDLVVMSDSDTRVASGLLHIFAAEFQDIRLGVATCLYRAVSGKSIWGPV